LKIGLRYRKDDINFLKKMICVANHASCTNEDVGVLQLATVMYVCAQLIKLADAGASSGKDAVI
jgi:hypothetical protein